MAPAQNPAAGDPKTAHDGVDPLAARAASPATAEPRTGDVLVLTEEALAGTDAAQIVSLHEQEEEVPAYRVLVPADTERNLLADVVDHLSLFELREALESLRERRPEPEEARTEAAEALATSLASLRSEGAQADGEVVGDDPLPSLERAVAAGGVREVVVVTRPHAVEDTFHRDWASRARETLGVPVLHLYAGTTYLG